MKIKYKNKISLKHLKQAAYKQSSARSEVHNGEARKHQKNYDGSQIQFLINEKDIPAVPERTGSRDELSTGILVINTCFTLFSQETFKVNGSFNVTTFLR